jgi:hypothetical protein
MTGLKKELNRTSNDKYISLLSGHHISSKAIEALGLMSILDRQNEDLSAANESELEAEVEDLDTVDLKDILDTLADSVTDDVNTTDAQYEDEDSEPEDTKYVPDSDMEDYYQEEEEPEEEYNDEEVAEIEQEEPIIVEHEESPEEKIETVISSMKLEDRMEANAGLNKPPTEPSNEGYRYNSRILRRE